MIVHVENPQESTKFLELLRAEQLNRHFTKRDTPMENKHRKDTQYESPLWKYNENHNDIPLHTD